jgi:hypothetical protein
VASKSMELRPKMRKGGEKYALFWKLQHWVARIVLNVTYGRMMCSLIGGHISLAGVLIGDSFSCCERKIFKKNVQVS